MTPGSRLALVKVGLEMPDPTTLTAPAIREIRAAWELFVSGDESRLGIVSAEIRESWRRSKDAGVPPRMRQFPPLLGPQELERRHRENQPLLEAAHDAVLRMSNGFAGRDFVAGITDRDGNLIYSYAPPAVAGKMEELNVLPGVGWQEESIGTTSSSLALRLKKPIQVYWCENYLEFAQEWAGCSAPIRSQHGDVVGVLGVSGYRIPVNAKALGLVTSTALFIEQRLADFAGLDRLLVLEAFTRYAVKFPESSILAIDVDGRVLALSTAMARAANLTSPEQVIGRRGDEIREFRVDRSGLVSSDLDPRETYGASVFFSSKEKAYPGTILPIRSRTGAHAGAMVIVSAPRPTAAGKPAYSSWQARHTFASLVGESPVFRQTIELAKTAAGHDYPVLLLGESGTGKELLAQSIHNASARAAGPFVALNCSVILKELAGAELFGYEEGAFSGAIRGGRRGKVELAHQGTLFLDELGDMPIETQAALLRFLEEWTIVPLGGEATRRVDVRMIAAMSGAPSDALAQGKLRLDLYHRLNLFPITLAPLRDRLEDLTCLVRHFFEKEGFSGRQISDDAMRMLWRHCWPGNVRELRNVLIRAAMLAAGGTVTAAHLPTDLPASGKTGASDPTGFRPSAYPSSEQIRSTLASCRGNVSEAARRLGIHRVTLHRKLRKIGIN
ncbi:MAG: sigma-54-dependent Fis family transcriptional regulator [Candidatus Binataceae bacterium]|nr:sigma-54-dependent Fis family transcriptional regulator [Candidatus Binataceae bacterium]